LILIGGKKVSAGTIPYICIVGKGDYALIVKRHWEPPATLPKAASDRSNRQYPHMMDYTAPLKPGSRATAKNDFSKDRSAYL
jgi:hypothetical protein